ncbi:MAG: C1 family peptidase [Bacteriovoracaceae bacterium]|nr:C1 family peptidase [Bacteriovoracaceae bacterium]
MIVLFFLFLPFVHAQDDLILNSIWHEINQQLPIEKQKQYENYLKLNDEVKTTEVTEEVEVKVEKKSVGAQRVEEMKARVRDELKNKKALPVKEKGLESWAAKQEEFLRSHQKKIDTNLKTWQQKYETTLRKWSQAHEAFLKRLPEYKKAAFDIPIEKQTPVEIKKITRTLTQFIPKTYHLVNSAFTIPIKDQKRRATCSAFAGVRAIEITLAQQNNQLDLSEQYFYWASKPNCRKNQCSEKGSWVGYGLDYSKEYALPTESQCPYNQENLSGNETQIPMSLTCKTGEVLVVDYSHLETLDQAIVALDKNQIIILGIKLKENFYTTKGIVFQNAKNARDKGLDSHANGHALILEGYIKLPPELNESEGKVCFLAANSWGEGWGKGGHACLSEKWLTQNRGKNPMVTVTKVRKK